MVTRINGAIAADFERRVTVDIRDFVTDEGVNDDWSGVLQAAVNAAGPDKGVVTIPAITRFINAPITINDPIAIEGATLGTRLIAGTALAGNGYMLDVTTASGHPSEGLHLPSFRLSKLFLDGNGRSVDAGAIRMSKVQRAIVNDVQVRHFTRSALHFPQSVRNSRFRNLWFKHNGDLFNGYAQVQIENPTGSPDSANLNIFEGCDFIYPAGYNLWIKSDKDDAQIRQHWFVGCTFHGAPESFSSETLDGYTITRDERWLAGGLVLQNTTSTYFMGCDMEYGNHGFPILSIQDNADYAQSTSNGVILDDCVFGAQDNRTQTVGSIDTTTNVVTITDHRFPTCALVQVSSTTTLPGGVSAATDYYVRRLTSNTFSLHTSWEGARKNTSVVDITSAGSGTITVTSQDIAICANRIGYMEVDARFHGSTNRAKIVNKHLANKVRLSGSSRTEGSATDIYDGPDATDLLADWRGGDIAADALRVQSPNATEYRISVDDAGRLLVGSGVLVGGVLQSKSSNYTALSTDGTILATGGASGITITLPAVAVGQRLEVKKVDSGAGPITVAPASGTIDGAANAVIYGQYDALTFVSNGTNWFRF